MDSHHSIPPTSSNINNSCQQEQNPIPPLRETILNQKQAKSLRRWCRRLANKAQHDGQKIQLKQIATLLALAHATIPLFTNQSNINYLQIWLDNCRYNGAQWYDRRILSLEAIQQLRLWNVQIKKWTDNYFSSSSSTNNNNETDNSNNLNDNVVIQKDNVKDVWNIQTKSVTSIAKPSPNNRTRTSLLPDRPPLVDQTNTYHNHQNITYSNYKSINNYNLSASLKGSSIHPAHTDRCWRKNRTPY